MIRLGPNMLMPETAAELPDFRSARRLFKDAETTAFVPDAYGNNPWIGHRACGWAVTADDCQDAYYIPIRHRASWEPLAPQSRYNLPLEAVQRWQKDVIGSCKAWVNHNVKFDAHFAAADGVDLGYGWNGQLVDTIVLAKIIDSDRGYGRGTYGLDSLALDWLKRDIAPLEQRMRQFLDGVVLPRRAKCRDYAVVPADVMGAYACGDVLANRDLYNHVLKHRSPGTKGVWDTEVRLTLALLDLEREGLRVDPTQLQMVHLVLLHEVLRIEEEIERICGSSHASSNEDCYELLVNRYGLPVLSRNDDTKGDDGEVIAGGPCFDKEALAMYAAHPDVASNQEAARVLALLLVHRKKTTLLNFFIKPYQELQVDGRLHPVYNQVIRTGRMSCKMPNAQQLSPEAKALILPDLGGAYLSCDYSQIEFRLIVHYINNRAAIDAYAADPETDFHQWVAKMCGIHRKPAKTINFCIGFGGGRAKVTSMLAANMELVGSLVNEVNKMIEDGSCSPTLRKETFDILCKRRAESTYRDYHATLPTLKATSRRAAATCVSRGYVINAYGRERRLPEKIAHKAFNNVVQGSAADLMKERTVALAPRYNCWVRETGLTLRASVHDETLLHGSPDATRDPRVVRTVTHMLEDVPVKLSVPIRTSAGWSDKTWKGASGDDGKVEIDRALQPFEAVPTLPAVE